MGIEMGQLKSPLVKKAINFAIEKHNGQLDKGGFPYVGHLFRVAMRVSNFGEDAIVTALLHDVVEDTPVTLDEVEAEFGKRIRDAVDGVTRREPSTGYPEKEKYFDFVKRSMENEISHVVKIADILDNSDPDRIAQLPEEQRGVVKRYEKALKMLRWV